jgi:hypothetical protein
VNTGWRLGLAGLLLISGCAHARREPDTLAPARMYDVTNFNGEWRLVNESADQGRRDDWFLPTAFRIDGDRSTLRIEDDSGELISEIALDSDYRNGSFGGERNYGVQAHWINDREFQIDRTSRGRTITQTYSLGNRGRRLLVEVEVERDGGSNTSSRVYRRI